jgi:CheY-like chemotaxis protein
MDRDDQFLPEFGVRVFLVEDSVEHCFIAAAVIRQLLGEASELIIVDNTEEAVGLIGQFTEHEHPDLMLVDLRLPDNGGFGVLAAIRQNDACKGVPAFVITSSIFDYDIAHSYELGASAVLCKPLSRASLREELIRIGKLPPLESGTRIATAH